MNAISTIRILVSLALPLAMAFAYSPADAPPDAGQQAPQFALPSQDGTVLGPKDFRGKWVVLYFYPKDNTPGCTIEAHNFQRDLAQYEAGHAVIVGVSVDSADSHQDFCAKQGLTFKLLADTDKKVVAQYGSLAASGVASRNTFLIDPQGKIVKVWTKVDPSHHSEEVLAALGQLQH
jgi:thioredoxin-dependent peroxiredoxin